MRNLEVRESIQGIYIQGLTEIETKSAEEALEYMEQGEAQRVIAETNQNEQSSRSHTVFRINIEIKTTENGVEKFRTSMLNLVDLAGSEAVSKTKANGLRFREGSNINKSLLALSKVIHWLSTSSGKGKIFINYWDSKLTRILQPALGGNSQTSIICTLSQLYSNYSETINTILFG